MKRLKWAAEAITEDLNREDSLIIKSIGKGTDGMFAILLFFGLPFICFVLWQFLM